MQETQKTWIPEPERFRGEGNGNVLPVFFLPGGSHGERSLAGYSPWGSQSQTRLKQPVCTCMRVRYVSIYLLPIC